MAEKKLTIEQAKKKAELEAATAKIKKKIAGNISQPKIDFSVDERKDGFKQQLEPTPQGFSMLSATPAIQQTVFNTTPAAPVKTSTLDIILFDEESVPVEVMSDLIFENIGGQELISITRSDIVNGQKIIYQPIKNLSSIQQQYNPNNILGLQQTSNKYFAGFSIKLEDKIPNQGNGANGQNVYLDSNGNLVIEFININADEQVETQITLGGTIYEANLGDYTS